MSWHVDVDLFWTFVRAVNSMSYDDLQTTRIFEMFSNHVDDDDIVMDVMTAVFGNDAEEDDCVRCREVIRDAIETYGSSDASMTLVEDGSHVDSYRQFVRFRDMTTLFNGLFKVFTHINPIARPCAPYRELCTCIQKMNLTIDVTHDLSEHMSNTTL